MKKNKRMLMERHIYLEKWLKDNYPINMTDKEIVNYFCENFNNKNDVEYLIDAYALPREEISKEMLICTQTGYNINELGDTLGKKYSISKDKALKRVHQIIDMDMVKEKLIKPKIKYTSDNVSNIIDRKLKKENKDEFDKKIILEKFIEDNADIIDENFINYIYHNFDESCRNYLLRSINMPRKEIIAILKKYNYCKETGIESVASLLASKYEVSIQEISERIEEVVVMEYLIKKEQNKKENKNKKTLKR